MIEQMVVDPDAQDDPQTHADPKQKDDPKPEADDKTDTPSADKSKSGDLPKWLYSVPEPLRDDLKEYSSSSEAWSALVDLRGRASKSIELLGEDATPEQIAAYHKRLGRPDGPEGYGLEKPSDWPEEIPWDDGMLRVFAQNAFSAGLSRKQARELFAQDVANAAKLYKGMAEKRAAQRKANKAMLLEMGGGTEEGVAKLLAESEQAFRVVGSPELLTLLKSHGLHEHPLVIQSYQRAYRAVKDDTFFKAHESEVNKQTREEPWRKIYEEKTRH